MTGREKEAIGHARELLAGMPLVDGHNDLPWLIRNDPVAQGSVAAYGLDEKRQGRDTDIPRLRQGLVSGQFWAAFVPTETDRPAQRTLEQIDLIKRMNAHFPEVFAPAHAAGDLGRARREGRIASFIAVENGVGLENSLDLLDTFRRLGVSYMTLCHTRTLDWVDSATGARRHGGLTDFGHDVVGEMNRLGIIVDCAHVSAEAMHQVIDTTRSPIIVSHANARAVCDHPRNVPDDLLDRIPGNGGMVMATFVPDFVSAELLSWNRNLRETIKAASTPAEIEEARAAYFRQSPPRPDATLAEVVDHIQYLAERMGTDHVGIGSDFFGGPATRGLEDVSCFPALIAELIERGWSDEAIAKLAGGNIERVLGEVAEKAGHE